MKNGRHAIQSYSLFGESTHLPDVMHCETIADRSVLHDWELSPHRHARLHQVLLVQSGCGTVSLDGTVSALTAGSLVNVPPGHVHAFRFKKGTCGWVATFADELLDEILVRVGDVRADLGRACEVQADASIHRVMEQIWQEFSGSSKARALVLRGLSAVLLGWVARAMGAQGAQPSNFAESNLVQRFRGLIDAHFLAHWRVADYARALAVSPTHLSRLTRAATGDSALRMIEARTIREARRQLAYTNLSVTTIAYALGYGDPAYFTRVFRRDAGVSPRVFRAKLS
ncbi:MAG: helix-turn-helix domain-containing protein [Burkholderiales bacterium]|nr:helix-turn-helix domain-containing protein [Burkholderiales bacterium]